MMGFVQCTYGIGLVYNHRTVQRLPLVALSPPPGNPPFYRVVTLLQCMLGNDAVVMKVLEVG